MKFRSNLFAAVAGVFAIGTVVAWQANAAETISLSKVSHIHGIAVDRTDPSRIFLATHHGVFLTNPDGTATRVSEDRSDYMGFTPAPTDPNTFYASGHPVSGGNLGFLLSKDGARTWTQVSQGANGPVDFHAMDASPANPNVLYGLYGGIQASQDGGKTWEVTGKPPADTFSVAASAKDPKTLYAATRDGLMVSRDVGKTWQAASMVRRPATMVETTADGTTYAFQVGTGLLKTTEPSLAWQPVSNGFGESFLVHLAVDPASPERLFGVTEKSQVLSSSDGGKTWKPLAS